ncbi:MAG TPA: hypothetical protein VE968_09055 [Sphingomicrobium sp.]|nr:hypothetical protein [Sphingomicrobium sp.]
MIERRIAQAASDVDRVSRMARDLQNDVRRQREESTRTLTRNPVKKVLVGFSFATSALQGRTQ